ncbi:MAG: restriction endonuclease [Coriobacteriia bacterium]|nr:restriction endonuclease [Coriobacteriia bacterium]
MSIEQKIDRAIDMLATIGMPRVQLNDRSALCLLALLDLKPEDAWSDASSPLIGITPIMDWCKENYNRQYAPNTRETFRRQSMHQFVEAGVAVYNPDDPNRPVNSPKTVYQISPEFLMMVKSYETPAWDEGVRLFKKVNSTLNAKYAKSREQKLVPIRIDNENELKLSPGEHSKLILEIIEEFGPRFAPGGKLVYIGDTGNKNIYLDRELLASLDIILDEHGKMPDVILFDEQQGWLFLIEAVTSHGPVDGKRQLELVELFSDAQAALVFVSAFPTFGVFSRFLPDIAWETEVWVSDTPSHLIHFDGERFLGLH